MHVGRTGKHQKVGAKGKLGPGWPDLVLVKGGRIIFAELKIHGNVLSEEQRKVRQALHQVGEYYVWRPSDFGLIIDTLAV
jgi:hypothetical protein